MPKVSCTCERPPQSRNGRSILPPLPVSGAEAASYVPPFSNRSWRHSSIASRAAFLRQLAEQEGALNRFMRLVQITKLMIVVGIIIGVGGILILNFMGNG